MSTTEKMYVGMDVHEDTVTVAVLPEVAVAPTVVKRLPNEGRKLRRFFDRLSLQGDVYAFYEGSDDAPTSPTGRAPEGVEGPPGGRMVRWWGDRRAWTTTKRRTQDLAPHPGLPPGGPSIPVPRVN